MVGPNRPVSRRRFCVDACQLASCGAVAAMATACSKSPTAPGGNVTTLGTLSGQFSGGTVQVTVVGSALDGVGGAAVVESIAGLFLVARTAADAVVAIDAVCTHQGCTVNGIDGTIYVCPCHGSRYSRTGQVVNGPAPASLRQYTAAIAGGVVSITL